MHICHSKTPHVVPGTGHRVADHTYSILKHHIATPGPGQVSRPSGGGREGEEGRGVRGRADRTLSALLLLFLLLLLRSRFRLAVFPESTPVLPHTLTLLLRS
eukprot:2492847-Rhodomonas_salina.1